MATATKRATITIRATIKAPVEKVWNLWTKPEHIVHWNNASDDWHTTRAETNFHVGGKFLSRMEARDGSSGFDFVGEYTKIVPFRQIEYNIADGRKVQVSFQSNEKETAVKETFEAEQENSMELQQNGWQSILDNFKKYVEASIKLEVMHFDISINASVEKVFSTMFDAKKYAEWTSEFNADSHFKGSWEKGSKILFVGTDKEGNMGGMVSKIRENIPNKFVSIEHLGIVKSGIEILSGPEVDEWAGARENYTFSENNGKTIVKVDIDSNEEFKSYFSETWPKALKKLKEICE